MAVAVWRYPKSRTFQCPHALPVRRWTKSWEGPWPRQLTQAGHRDIPDHRMPCSAYELGGVGWKGLTTALGQAGHWSVGDEKLYYACFSGFIFITAIIISSGMFYFVSFIKLFLTHRFFSDSPPNPTTGTGSV